MKSMNICKNNTYTFRKKFSTIFNPNSLVFSHKKELDKIQKQTTRMKTPKNIEELEITEEIDFEPGLEYLSHTDVTLKLCPKRSDFNSAASPEDGFIQIQFPFDKDSKLRKNYRLLHYERIRSGKLLE